MRKITKFLMAGVLLLTGFLGITNTRNEVKEVEAATTRRVYFDANESGREWMFKDGSNSFNIYYYSWKEGTSSNNAGWPGVKLDTSNYIEKWGRQIYYVDVDASFDGLIFTRSLSTNKNDVWQRWNIGPNSTYCLSKGYNFYQPNSTKNEWSGNYQYGTTDNGAGYAAQKLYVATLHNGGSTSNEYYITNWEKTYAPADLKDTATHTFEGWYTDANFTTKYTAKALTSDINLYAKWAEIPATPELSIAVTPVEKSGLKFYAGFPAEDVHHIKNENVGFKFVFSGTGVETKTGYYVCSTTTQTITNIVDGEPVTLNAADNGYAFYFGVIIENIPEGYNSVEITPAYQHTNGTTIYLTAKTLNFTVENAVVNF